MELEKLMEAMIAVSKLREATEAIIKNAPSVMAQHIKILSVISDKGIPKEMRGEAFLEIKKKIRELAPKTDASLIAGRLLLMESEMTKDLFEIISIDASDDERMARSSAACDKFTHQLVDLIKETK